MPKPIWRDEVQRLVRDEAAQLVEVLPPPMYQDEHIEGSINIPLKELDRDTTSFSRFRNQPPDSALTMPPPALR